jgi:hypothetical protein
MRQHLADVAVTVWHLSFPRFPDFLGQTPASGTRSNQPYILQRRGIYQMRKVLVLTVFMFVVAWAVAQQPGTTQQPSGGQTTSPSSPQPGAERGPQGQPSDMPITEGCLGGSNPNFTITDKAGTTYKLNFPPDADISSLASHVGESVQVAGEVKDGGGAGKATSIDAHKIGKGTGTCPAKGSKPPSP